MHHKNLNAIAIDMPEDYHPWGTVMRWADPDKYYPDCSHGCKWFYKLASKGQERLGNDWGVCANPKSHRRGLLTFEHQGCMHCDKAVTNGDGQ